jgi:small subunit ribosomal protein S18
MNRTMSEQRETTEQDDQGPRGPRPDRGDRPRGDRPPRDRDDRGGDRGGGRRPPRRFRRGKVCGFCVGKVQYVDYKDLERLRRYVTDRGKILPRRITGNCARHQRMLCTAIKRARTIALIPYKVK